MSRLERFRTYMTQMNPVADALRAIRDGLYVVPPDDGVSRKLANQLELEPTSRHLLVGGIGSGKTSEALRACDLVRGDLAESGDEVHYIDVSKRHDLGSTSLAGVLTALAGLTLVRGLRSKDLATKPGVEAAIAAIEGHARGRMVFVPDDDDYPGDYEDSGHDEQESGHYEHVKGVLKPPQPPVRNDLKELHPHLQLARIALTGGNRKMIFVFDSLDRLPTPELFRDAVIHDVRVLASAGFGLCVIGPVRFIVDRDRTIFDLFDHTHFQLPSDPSSTRGADFLRSVLRARAGVEMLPDAATDELTRASGGVLRDVLQLAKLAGSIAYSAGRDSIDPEDVARAVDDFGRDLAVGLDNDHVKLLKHVRRGKGFVVRGDRELSLIESRRVLSYGSTWAVHPCLVGLLDAIPEAT